MVVDVGLRSFNFVGNRSFNLFGLLGVLSGLTFQEHVDLLIVVFHRFSELLFANLALLLFPLSFLGLL